MKNCFLSDRQWDTKRFWRGRIRRLRSSKQCTICQGCVKMSVVQTKTNLKYCYRGQCLPGGGAVNVKNIRILYIIKINLKITAKVTFYFTLPHFKDKPSAILFSDVDNSHEKNKTKNVFVSLWILSEYPTLFSTPGPLIPAEYPQFVTGQKYVDSFFKGSVISWRSCTLPFYQM